jgi:hypothetical protein
MKTNWAAIGFAIVFIVIMLAMQPWNCNHGQAPSHDKENTEKKQMDKRVVTDTEATVAKVDSFNKIIQQIRDSAKVIGGDRDRVKKDLATMKANFYKNYAVDTTSRSAADGPIDFPAVDIFDSTCCEKLNSVAKDFDAYIRKSDTEIRKGDSIIVMRNNQLQLKDSVTDVQKESYTKLAKDYFDVSKKYDGLNSDYKKFAQKKKHFSVGPFVGAAVMNGRVLPTIGGGITYSIFQF